MDLISISRTIDAPIGEVWAITSSFGTIKFWMPGIEKISVTGAGIGAVRTMQSGLGVASERLEELDADRHHVRYSITGENLSGWEGFIGGTDLEAVGDNATRITWVAQADKTPGDIGPIIGVLETFITESIAGLGRALDADVHGGEHGA